MGDLTLYDRAREAIAKCERVDDVKEWIDKAAAVREYARRANDRTMETQAISIRLRAERKQGELLRDMDLAPGGKPYHSSSGREARPVETLADMGITKDQSARSQQLASMPESEFEDTLEDLQDQIKSGAVRPTVDLLAHKRRMESKAKADAPRPVVKPPEGLYSVVVLDPPWPMQKIDRPEAAPLQTTNLDYPVMTLKEISDLRLPLAPDCHVFLWTTQRFLPDSLDLIEGWGLRYVCLYTWAKNGGFQPVGLPQYNAQHVVYARHGTPKFTSQKAHRICFAAPRAGHSVKPEEFYNMIRYVTDGPRLDMFARKQRIGYAVGGNEATKHNQHHEKDPIRYNR